MADTPSEIFLYRDHPSWLYFYALILLGVFVVCVAGASAETVVSVICIILAIAYARYRRLYTVTAQRIIMRIGLIANNSNEMEIRHIRGINVRQGAIERMLGVGTLEIISAADGGAEVVFRGIRNPNEVKELIRGLRPAPE
jgi:uncharacterized membrane protein YdbT with pleckstrin-like domain